MIAEKKKKERKRFVYKRKDLTVYRKMKCVSVCYVKISSKILTLFYRD